MERKEKLETARIGSPRIGQTETANLDQNGIASQDQRGIASQDLAGIDAQGMQIDR